MTNFIVLAPNKWDGVWMNRQHLFSIIGRDHNVMYSNGLYHTWDIAKGKLKDSKIFGSTVTKDNISIYSPPKFALRKATVPFYDEYLLSRFCKQLQKTFTTSGLNILYVFNPKFYQYISHINYDYLVYHPYDDFSKIYGGSTQNNQEQLILDKAHAVITTSQMLHDNYCKLTDPDKVNFVPNGVDYSLFHQDKYIEPVDLAEIKAPRVGYTGSINSKIDFALLIAMALAKPEINFCLTGTIGKLDSFQVAEYEELLKLDNVYFLGGKALDEVPHYMKSMDINIIPYRVDKDSFANSGYPLKYHEYLAVGQPIICSGIDSAFEFSDVMVIPLNAQEWVQTISYTLDNQHLYSDVKITQKRAVATKNTWQARVEHILKIINEIPES